MRIATVYWKPHQNVTALKPDYHVRTTEEWLVFPHELVGLTAAEIADKSPAIGALLQQGTAMTQAAEES